MQKNLNPELGLFNHLSDGAFAIDTTQTIIFWSDTAEEILGYKAEDAVGRKCWELLHGEDLYSNAYCRPDCPVISQIRRDLPVCHFSLIVYANDGTKHLIDMSTLPFSTVENGLQASILLHLHRPLALVPT